MKTRTYATSQPLGYFGDGDDNRPDGCSCSSCGEHFDYADGNRFDPEEDHECHECQRPMCPECYDHSIECRECRAAWIQEEDEMTVTRQGRAA